MSINLASQTKRPFDFRKASKMFSKRFLGNRTESLARDRIFGKTWQDFSGVAWRENSYKKNLVKSNNPKNSGAPSLF